MKLHVKVPAGVVGLALGALALNVLGLARIPVGPLRVSDVPGDSRQMTIITPLE